MAQRSGSAPSRQGLALALAIGLPGAALAGAYLAEYGFGLLPCEMCWWQRWPHFAALALALGAAALPLPSQSFRLLAGLAALAIAISGGIGAFHAGVEYGWWQGLTGCAAMPSGSGDPLANILAAPIIRCDQAAFRFLTISMAGWNALVSLGGAVCIAALLTKGKSA